MFGSFSFFSLSLSLFRFCLVRFGPKKKSTLTHIASALVPKIDAAREKNCMLFIYKYGNGLECICFYFCFLIFSFSFAYFSSTFF